MSLWALAALAQAASGTASGPPSACPPGNPVAGFVQQVSGQVALVRDGRPMPPPVIMQPVCVGDVLSPKAPGGSVTVRIERLRASQTVRAPASLVLPPRGRSVSLGDNVFSLFSDEMLPNLRRHTLVAASRGSGPLSWSDAGLADGAARLAGGQRGLMVRWAPVSGIWQLELRGPDGRMVYADRVEGGQARIAPRLWTDGVHRLSLRDPDDPAGEPVLTGAFTVGPPPPSARATGADWAGAEVRAAAEALRIARLDARVWSFEAAQVLDAAPSEGLDRDVVLKTIAGLAADPEAPRP